MKISILLILFSFILSELTLAHGGRTNASGCHNNRKTGGYHCHGGNSNSTSSNKNHTPTKPSASTKSNLLLQTQKYLNRLGYDAGPEDGVMGKKTREAIKRFQKKTYENVDGKASNLLLKKLKQSF